MRTFKEALAASRDGYAFANGTEGYGWMDNWCDRCIHDLPVRQDKPEDGCPLILVAMSGRIPSEFLDGPRDEQDRYSIAEQYHCIEFRDEDAGPGPEPQPVPDPPGMEALIPREPYSGPLMFTANTMQEVSA